MNILRGLMLLGIGIVVGRVYEYRLNLKECEKAKVLIIGKDGTEIPIVFKDETMNEWLRKEIEISFDEFKDEIVQVKQVLLKITGDN
ncbi:TPA: hypothetical protein KPK86_003641 [Clostridioides difficile]|nr:hypothetical protein [Clostridioides difficile]